jgi:hypothetical protein
MRTRTAAWALPFLVVGLGLAGCAAETSGDGAGDQTQDVTGGSGAIESPVVFLFDSTAADAAPKCAGAMIADTFAVTAKSCAKVGLILGHAADKDGHGKRAQITKIHTPPGADADIVVVEVDKALKGTHALITHMPLRDGYAVNAFAATDGKGLFAPDKNDASSVAGTMIEETASHGSLVPAKGTEICDGDIGAPVCSSTGGKIAGYNLYGTCGLSGLVVSRATPAPAVANGSPAEPSCSGGAWKIAQLGQYAEFLRSFAPKAFEPWFIDAPVLRDHPYYAPDGLWGYKTKGDVKACKLDAATLAPVAPGVASSKLTAKVSFAGMDKNAAAFGRFGIAPKSDPTNMRWLPAKLTGTAGVAFDAQFDGVVSAQTAGDYFVAFRASANGGETWTVCDTGGIADGRALKAIVLKVADPSAPSTNPATPPSTPTTTPSDTGSTGSTGGEGSYSDPPATPGESTARDPGSDPSEDYTPSTKSGADMGGCSMSSAPLRNLGGTSLPMVGALLGLAALVRRRRTS